MRKHKILSTKKLDPDVRDWAAGQGLDVNEQEFITIRPLLSKDLHAQIIAFAETGRTVIALTSAQAVEMLERYMHVGDTVYVIAWKAYCLSGKTKEALLGSRWLKADIKGEAQHAAALAQEIIRQGEKELVFFCGNRRRKELPALLQEAGVRVHEIVLYETLETPEVAAGDIEAVLFFSPSAVQSFFSVNQLSSSAVCFAIGDTTARSIADHTDNRVITSEAPTQEMLLAAVHFYFQNSNCYE